MEAVYVLEPGTFLKREGAVLKLVRGNEVISSIPASGLKRLILMGYVSLTGAVLDFLITNRIETVFLTPTGRFRARLGIDEHRHVTLRKAQYDLLGRPEAALSTARMIVEGKIRNSLSFLRLRARQYDAPQLRMAAAQLRSLLFQAQTAKDVEILRGIEGAAARAYFSVFCHLIKNEAFEFKGRNKRPPLDPVNALLSFVYTLLTNEVLSAIKTCGLDPYLGSLHDVSYGRPSLACDLVEEYRCFLGDRLVLGLLNRRAIEPRDFIYRKTPPAEFADEDEMKAKRPVEMKPAVGRAFVAAYEEMMKRPVTYPPLQKKIGYRWLMVQQVRHFADYLTGDSKNYKPFSWDNS
jgi:CRISPR-associated protein Cas1